MTSSGSPERAKTSSVRLETYGAILARAASSRDMPRLYPNSAVERGATWWQAVPDLCGAAGGGPEPLGNRGRGRGLTLAAARSGHETITENGLGNSSLFESFSVRRVSTSQPVLVTT